MSRYIPVPYFPTHPDFDEVEFREKIVSPLQTSEAELRVAMERRWGQERKGRREWWEEEH
jgi:hypothetical protein